LFATDAVILVKQLDKFIVFPKRLYFVKGTTCLPAGRQPQRRAAISVSARIPGEIKLLEEVQPLLCSMSFRIPATRDRERAMGIAPGWKRVMEGVMGRT
jgi:hypothetical protein